VYVAAADVERPDALRLVVRFAGMLPAATRALIDGRGATRPLLPARGADLAAAALTPALLGVARAVTAVGLALVRRPTVPARPPGARTALLIPVLPDLSHTFVYREALGLARRRPEWDVLALERGDASVVHGDAAALGALAAPVERLGPNRYLLAYLRHWLTRPRAMAGLVRFFAPHTATFGPGARADDRLAFLRLEYLEHSSYLAAGLVLAETLRRRRIGHVHVWGSTFPAVRALVAQRLLGVSVSLSTFVDFDYPTPFWMLEEKVAAARFVVACTAFCRARLAERCPAHADRLRLLRHALPRGWADGGAPRPADGASRLVYVGRLVPKKGLDTLVRAVARLAARGAPVTCHLYGRGEAEPALRALVAALGLDGRVVFEGPIPNERVRGIMNGDDLFVCPSRLMPDGERDGIPVSLLEAMAAGVPVVATPVSGIPEAVEDGVNGWLVPPDDPDALAARLAAALAAPGERVRVAAAARRTVAERFALEEAVGTLEAWISRESRSGA
jgi:glycosyltransferase involved in cell wall biosynthesis